MRAYAWGMETQAHTSEPLYDLLIVGGGINGAGIARDAAGRGLKVKLVEMNDLASGTSSWSTKLIHGGLRYLEYYEFRLVREALIEREVLWSLAPHIIQPLRFVLPHHKGLRPRWLLRLGLFLYDHIGGRKNLPTTRSLDLSHHALGAPLKPDYAKGFEYSDARVDDARLVILNAMAAREAGADIETRCKLVYLAQQNGAGNNALVQTWCATLQSTRDGQQKTLQAKAVINAAGPWVDTVLRTSGAQRDARHIRLVQGSHIITRQLYDHDRAYIFQNSDGRIAFTIPYQGRYTLIGTTDTDFDGDPQNAAITETEIDYLIKAVGDYFKTPISRDDIVSTYSGVRSLYDDGANAAQEATRDYVLEIAKFEAPLLNVFGGKLTTYRRLAESAMDRLKPYFQDLKPKWTAKEPLPGGDFEALKTAEVTQDFIARFGHLPSDLVTRLFFTYGTKTADILGNAKSVIELGQHFGHGLYSAEVDYLQRFEWAQTAEDVLWRRTKLGLAFDKNEATELDKYLKAKRNG